MTILSYYCAHLEVSETPAVSFYRTFTDADTIRYFNQVKIRDAYFVANAPKITMAAK